MLLPLRTPSMHAIHLMACASLSYPTRSAQGRNPAPEYVSLSDCAYRLDTTRCNLWLKAQPLFMIHQRRAKASPRGEAPPKAVVRWKGYRSNCGGMTPHPSGFAAHLLLSQTAPFAAVRHFPR